MAQRVIVLNVGWMIHYRGLHNDMLLSEARYVREHSWGGEILNFLPFNGQMYGYVQPPGKKDIPYNDRKISITRLGASMNAPFVSGILVAWCALKPYGGTFLVGWYQNATMFEKWQSPPEGSDRQYQGEHLGYYVKAKEEDCVLLPPERRTLEVPRASNRDNRGKGGIGQANIWYADSGKQNDITFEQQLRKFVQNYRTNCLPNPSLHRTR